MKYIALFISLSFIAFNSLGDDVQGPSAQDKEKESLRKKIMDSAGNAFMGTRFEIDMGMTWFNRATNQTWWERDKEHWFHFVQANWALGINIPLGDFFNIKIKYEDLAAYGGVRMYSKAIAEDANYFACTAPGSTVKCKDVSNWFGRGDVKDVIFEPTVEIPLAKFMHFIDSRNFKFVRNTNVIIGIGISRLKGSWEEDIPDFKDGYNVPGRHVHVTHKAIWENGYVADFGLGYEDWELLFGFRTVGSSGDPYCGGYKQYSLKVDLAWIPGKTAYVVKMRAKRDAIDFRRYRDQLEDMELAPQ